MKKPIIAILSACWALSVAASAQEQARPWTESELEEEKVVILKERENELPPATRSFKKIPPEAPKNTPEKLQYTTNEPLAPLKPLEAQMRVVRVKSDPPAPYYPVFLKGAIGNYWSPLLQAHLSSPQAGPYFYHLQLDHESAATGEGVSEKGHAGFNKTGISGYTRYMTKIVGANLNAFYQRHRYNFYGYDLPAGEQEPDKSDIKQAYHRMGLGGELARLQQEDWQAGAELQLSRTSSNLELAENRLNLEGHLRYEISDLLALKFRTSALVSSFNQQEVSSSRNLIKLQPGFDTEYGPVKISGGFNFVLENDSESNTELRFYPMARAEFQPIAGLLVYGGLEGDVLPTTYDALSRENPWLGDSLDLRFTRKTFAFNGGAKTTLAGIGLHAGFEVATLKNQYFFLNDTLQVEQFQLVYDSENITRLSFWAQANYSYRDKWKLETDLKLLNYTTDELREAYHVPTLDFATRFSVNIFDKIYANAAFTTLGGIKAVDFVNSTTETPIEVDLDPVLKLDLGGEYRFSDQATGFIQFNNLLNRSDSRFYRYPSRKMVVQVGGTYAF